MSLSADQVWMGVGFLGQAFFFSRGLVQWIASERSRKVVVPSAFWWMSLAGGVCSFAYTLYREEFVFLLAQAVSLFIYPRNLLLLRSGKSLNRNLTWPLLLGFLTILAATTILKPEKKLIGAPPLIVLVGLLGALLWTLRFPLQWWISERKGISVLPPMFMWVSLSGSVLLLVYAIWTRDPVWILGQALGPILYGRNLWLGRRREGTREAF